MQETWDWALGWEDPTCHGVTKPVHNYWACVLESRSWNFWAHVSQLLKPELNRACAPQQESPLQWEALKRQLEKNPHSNKDLAQPKINNINK